MAELQKYISEAKKYLEMAIGEIKKSKENGKLEMAVDGCEKGWLALNLALQAMFIKKGVKEDELPQTYRGMRYFLIKYGNKDLQKLFGNARSVLHIDGFWDRDVVFETVESTLQDIKEYIEKLNKNDY